MWMGATFYKLGRLMADEPITQYKVSEQDVGTPEHKKLARTAKFICKDVIPLVPEQCLEPVHPGDQDARPRVQKSSSMTWLLV